MNSELNKKLAEWVFDEVELVCEPDREHPLGIIYFWKDGQHLSCELFTLSETACFRHLVPKLQFETITFVPVTGTSTELDSIQRWGCGILFKGWEKSISTIGDSETPALALCLAFEKQREENN